jgi:GntR family transcriptional regulator, transcriptional repressor for pyruvate dehydrogenase complex
MPDPEKLDEPFHPISGPKAAAEVVDQITHAISSGRFLPGSRLPNIDELSRLMNVSRPTVGDALRVLAKAGVVETRRGNTGGVLVNSSLVPPRLLRLAWRRVAHTLSALVEARHPVEMELALLAGRRATDQDFADLKKAVEMLKESVGDPRRWVQANNLFHYSIGRAAGSPVLSQFQHEVIEEMTVVLDGWNAEYYSGPDRVIEMHEQTLEALQSRDPDRIRNAMADHLNDAETIAPDLDRRLVKPRRSRRRGAPAVKEQGS